MALHHAHLRGVLHHDIKPANIIIDVTGRPLLTDFNIASSRGDSSSLDVIGGTTSYMSPEQLQAIECWMPTDAADVDVRSDIYSLGVVLFRLLTGLRHWPTLPDDEERSIAKLLADRLHSGPPCLADRKGITPALSSIVSRALQPRLDDRYQSALDFATDLERWLHRRPLQSASDPSMHERMSRFLQRNIRTLSALAVAIFVLVGMAVLRWQAELRQIKLSQTLVQGADRELKAGNSSGASERLGQARAMLTNTWWIRLGSGPSVRSIERQLYATSKRIGQFERQRFDSQFGEYRLATIHREHSPRRHAFVDNALKTYGVTRRQNWQQHPPFADLLAADKTVVAENITELLVVSMWRSSQKQAPQRADVRKVLARIPTCHCDLGVFNRIREGGLSPVSIPPASDVRDSFEAYLCAVLSVLASASITREPGASARRLIFQSSGNGERRDQPARASVRLASPPVRPLRGNRVLAHAG